MQNLKREKMNWEWQTTNMYQAFKWHLYVRLFWPILLWKLIKPNLLLFRISHFLFPFNSIPLIWCHSHSLHRYFLDVDKTNLAHATINEFNKWKDEWQMESICNCSVQFLRNNRFLELFFDDAVTMKYETDNPRINDII